MTTQVISAAVGALVRVLLEVVPGLRDRWAKWQFTPLVLFILFVGVPVVALVLTCYAGFSIWPDPSCTPQGFFSAAWAGFVAFLASIAAQGPVQAIRARIQRAKRG